MPTATAAHLTKHFSQSQHNNSACLRYHYYNKVLRYKRPLSANLVSGSHFHAGLEGVHKALALEHLSQEQQQFHQETIELFDPSSLKRKPANELATAALAYAQRFRNENENEFNESIWPGLAKNNSFKARASLDIWQAYLPGVLLDYVAYWDKQIFRPKVHNGVVWVEAMVKLPLAGTTVWLKSDVFTEDGYIVDHKTSTRRPDEEELAVGYQAAYYTWAYREIFGEMPRGVIFDYAILSLKPGFYRTKPIVIDSSGIEKITNDIEQQLQLIDWCHGTKTWPRNRTCCKTYGSMCEYYDECLKPQDEEDFGL